MTDAVFETCVQLVRKCQQGDKQSFRLLYERYHQRVRNTLYRLCGSEHLDDLQQEVFLRVWRFIHQLRNPQYFSTWLYRICWNVACDQNARLQKKQCHQVENRKEVELDNPFLLQLHYEGLVARGLQQLSLEHRAVIVLHDLEDLPQKEIAQILSIPVGTVKSRLFKARKKLREFLEKEGITL